jgi:cytochrome c oxidase cbb3-type subunit 3
VSSFWARWVEVLMVLNLGITAFLLLWGPRVKIPTLEDGTTGHVWAHGVLRESVRKLPTWWMILSVGVFVVGGVYLALYPGFGNNKGILGWTQVSEVELDTEANAVPMKGMLATLGQAPVETLAANPDVVRIGRRLFIDNCAACHGREGHGNPLLGAPDLGDQDWIYGGDGQAILTSIRDGRHGIMPPFGATFDAKAVENLANYVLGLSGSPHDEAKAAAGQPLFTVCAACHGSDGKGNALIGAPNLTDRTWLYGGTQATIEQTIREGRTGVMPAWRARLGDDGVKFVAAWVYAQSHAKAQAQSQSDAK